MNTDTIPRVSPRILLVIATMGAGGAERVMSLMANYWAANGRDVTLLTLGPADADFYPVHSGVHRLGLHLLAPARHPVEGLLRNAQRVMKLRSAIVDHQPDIVISFTDMTNILVLAATRSTGIPVVVSERVDPSHYTIGKMWEWARRRLYPLADRVVVQTNNARLWASSFVPTGRLAIIPNPVLVDSSEDTRVEATQDVTPVDTARPFIAAMGRLTPQKGFDMLLKAFAEVSVPFPEWSLVIFGEGEARAELEQLSARLQIAERVHFPGRIQNPKRLLREAEMFVLSSRFEGFPNALLEAMACGVACISFDCPSGPADIIRNGENGMLVPPNSVASLAACMAELMGNEAARLKLAVGARSVTQTFSVGRVMAQWDELIAAVIER